MKNFLKKVISSVAAVSMAVTIVGGVGSSTVFAEASTPTYSGGTATFDSAKGGQGTITINLPEKQGGTEDTPADNTDDNTTYEYKVYRVFQASVPESATGASTDAVSYSLVNGKTALPTDESYGTGYTGAKFYQDTAGNIYYGTVSDTETHAEGETQINLKGETTAKFFTPSSTLTEGAQAAIKAYVTDNDLAADVEVKTKEGSDKTTKLVINNLQYGYYYITTTTGSLVTVDTTRKSVTVDDKNTVPTVDKTITGVDDGKATGAATKGSVDTTTEGASKRAIAEVGSTVHFKSVITVGKGATNYVFKDTMSTGLSLTDADKENIKVTYGDNNAALTANTDYTITYGPTSSDPTFTITFTDSAEGTKAAMAEGTKITVSYTATLTASGLVTEPETNTAKVTYNNHDTTESKVNVYNATLTIKKVDGSNQPLGGAKFKLYKLDADGNNKTYYELADDGKSVSWVSDASQATEVEAVQTGGAGDYKASFAGLSDGDYWIEESVTPNGYNTAADQKITVKKASDNGAWETDNGVITNLNQSATIQNKSGSLLPSTGGIGTTIFYVIGGVLIAGAAILLITRRKKA